MIDGVNFRLFSVPTPGGKAVRAGVWNGLRDYSQIPPTEIGGLVGGPKLTIVQVARPTNGFEGRSSLALTHALAADFDGVIHWARDTKTFLSIVAELSNNAAELT